MFWRDEVLLIRKRRPRWQEGLLNGVGGHIELGESPAEAMAREFHEETGLQLEPEDWRQFCRLTSPRGIVYFFRHTAIYDLRPAAETFTDEPVEWWPAQSLPINVVANLRWLIPMALDEVHDSANVIEHARRVEAG